MFIYLLIIQIFFSQIICVPVSDDGVGSVAIEGDDIPASGVTVVDAVVPILGNVGFSGPVRASGTVTIIARSGPSRPVFPVYFSMIPVEPMPIFSEPLAEVAIPLVEEASIGKGSLSVLGEMPVRGVTNVEGIVPIIGDVIFGGQLLGKGSVHISGSCSY